MQQNSSRHKYSYAKHTSTATTTTGRPSTSGDSTAINGKWAVGLLRDCAMAISENDSNMIHHLMWKLNELASPYGDCDQKLAFHFLQALFYKVTQSGNSSHRTLMSVAEKAHSFELATKVILKFQEVSPWLSFGHVAANGAILEAMEGESKLHIVDISSTYCTQWPTLLESLATRNDETPKLRLTVVVMQSDPHRVMKEIKQKMEKFARLMGVPFEFHMVDGLKKPTLEGLKLAEDEALVINCVGGLRRVDVKEREDVTQMLCSMKPKVITIVEEEGDFISNREDFMNCFEECLRFYGLFFEMIDESFGATNNERLVLERECSRSLIKLLACDGDQYELGGCCERREKGRQWCERLRRWSLPVGFSDDIVDDVKALIKRYRSSSGWSFVKDQGDDSPGLYLLWKEEPVVWASAWKPRSSCSPQFY